MPNPIATDLDTLGDLFRHTIERIAPRHTRDALQRWRFTEQDGDPGLTARVFRFEWEPDFDSDGGIVFPTLVDKTIPLAIITDYGGIPKGVSRRVADSDSSQLREALHALCHTTPGLITVRNEDPPWEVRVENKGHQSQIEHLLLVRYWKQR